MNKISMLFVLTILVLIGNCSNDLVFNGVKDKTYYVSLRVDYMYKGYLTAYLLDSNNMPADIVYYCDSSGKGMKQIGMVYYSANTPTMAILRCTGNIAPKDTVDTFYIDKNTELNVPSLFCKPEISPPLYRQIKKPD